MDSSARLSHVEVTLEALQPGQEELPDRERSAILTRLYGALQFFQQTTETYGIREILLRSITVYRSDPLLILLEPQGRYMALARVVGEKLIIKTLDSEDKTYLEFSIPKEGEYAVDFCAISGTLHKLLELLSKNLNFWHGKDNFNRRSGVVRKKILRSSPREG